MTSYLRYFKPEWIEQKQQQQQNPNQNKQKTPHFINQFCIKISFFFLISKNPECKDLEISLQYVIMGPLVGERKSNIPLHWATTRKYHRKMHHGSRELNMWLFGQISILEWGLTCSSSHNMLVELFQPTLQMGSLLIRAWDTVWSYMDHLAVVPFLGFHLCVD